MRSRETKWKIDKRYCALLLKLVSLLCIIETKRMF
nr:MAG TPA: hypothetical protein [Caudoviricetes sp.]